jgi:hypothetical protein
VNPDSIRIPSDVAQTVESIVLHEGEQQPSRTHALNWSACHHWLRYMLPACPPFTDGTADVLERLTGISPSIRCQWSSLCMTSNTPRHHPWLPLLSLWPCGIDTEPHHSHHSPTLCTQSMCCLPEQHASQPPTAIPQGPPQR